MISPSAGRVNPNLPHTPWRNPRQSRVLPRFCRPIAPLRAVERGGRKVSPHP